MKNCFKKKRPAYLQRLLWLLFFISFGCMSISHEASSPQQNSQKTTNPELSVKAGPSRNSDKAEVQDQVATVPQSIPKQSEVSSELLVKGKHIYDEQCSRCHGPEGDGEGELASSLNPRPLDFTAGVFKFRSTPTGQLPTDDDLYRTISVGVAGTSMSDYQDLSQTDRRAVVEYVKNFSPRFREEAVGERIPPPPTRSMTADAVARGRHLFVEMFCPACHGDTAHGDGPLAQSLSDSNGRNIQPADLTKSRLKSGRGLRPVYRTLMTGLDGTPMPSFGDSLSAEEAWDLTLFIASLSQSGEAQ